MQDHLTPYRRGRQALAILLLLRSSAFAVSAPDIPPPSKGEFVLYVSQGGRATAPFEVRIDTDGRAVLDRNRVGSRSRHEFELTQDEMSLLDATLKDAEFFTATIDPNVTSLHCTPTTIRASRDNLSRTVKSCGSPTLSRLVQFFYKIYLQGEMLDHIAAGDIRSVHVGAAVLQPTALRNPLKEFIGRSSDRDKLHHALRVLQGLMTPDEWVGFLSEQLSRSGEKRRLQFLSVLSSIEFYIDRPFDQARAPLPLLFREIRRDYASEASFSKEKRSIYWLVIHQLCIWRYEPAEPFLMKYLRETDGSRELPPGADSIHGMMDLAVGDLEELLDSRKPHLRQFAAVRLTNMWGNLQDYRRVKPIYPLQDSQKEYLEERLIKIASTKLKQLAESDPDAGVRREASAGATWIGRPWDGSKKE